MPTGTVVYISGFPGRKDGIYVVVEGSIRKPGAYVVMRGYVEGEVSKILVPREVMK